MFGPKSNSNNSSSTISFDLSKKMAGSKTDSNLIQVFFGSQKRPVLSLISTALSTNTIKVYKCLNTFTYVLVKVEKNRIYRLTGPNLISIPINNIDINWKLICTHTNLNDVQIKELYKEYEIK